jgi:hypothetical protein
MQLKSNKERALIMNKEILDFTISKTHELIGAPSCSSEAKAAAQNWLDAIGTENEAIITKNYIDELEADIMPIENLIGFAESDSGIQVFGSELAKNIASHAKKIKSDGARYCDCPACASAVAIIEKKDDILK